LLSIRKSVVRELQKAIFRIYIRRKDDKNKKSPGTKTEEISQPSIGKGLKYKPLFAHSPAQAGMTLA